jgi:hypothetical protein
MLAGLRDILQRSWKGEFSLGRIFWTGAIAVILAVGFYAFVAPSTLLLLPEPYRAYGLFFLGLLFIPFPIFVILWLALIWRAERKRNVWLVPAIAAYCLLLCTVIIQAQVMFGLAGSAYSDLLGNPQWGPRGIRVNSENKSVLVYGYISRYVPNDLHPEIKLVEFDSLGGKVTPARQIAELIRSRGLNTRVSAFCISACTLAFSGGRERSVRDGATIGFHAAISGDDINETGTESSKKTLIAAGVASPFIVRAFQERPIWYPSAQEMKAAGFVTVILPNQDLPNGPGATSNLRGEVWDCTVSISPKVHSVHQRWQPSGNILLSLDGGSPWRIIKNDEVVLTATRYDTWVSPANGPTVVDSKFSIAKQTGLYTEENVFQLSGRKVGPEPGKTGTCQKN